MTEDLAIGFESFLVKTIPDLFIALACNQLINFSLSLNDFLKKEFNSYVRGYINVLFQFTQRQQVPYVTQMLLLCVVLEPMT